MPSKSQVDRLGDRLRSGEITPDTLRQLEEYRAGFGPAYEHVEEVLAGQLGRSVTGRPSKSTVAIIEKLRRESIRLTQIQDIAGCRVVSDDLEDQNSLCDLATVLLVNPTVVDRRKHPVNGYRAVHLIAKVGGVPVEVQVRTKLQHAWAEISEKISDSYGQGIKYGSGEQWALDFLASLSALTAELESLHTRTRSVARSGSRKAFQAAQLAERLCFYKVRALFNELNSRQP